MAAMRALIPCLLILFVGCGRAQYKGRSEAASVSVPIMVANSDYYFEFGQRVPGEASGRVEISKVILTGQAFWSGKSSAELELRLSLRGNTAANSLMVHGTNAPAEWAEAQVIFDEDIAPNYVIKKLDSGNIYDIAGSAIARQNFWLIVRVKALGSDVAESFTLENVQTYTEGTKSFAPLSPLTNLGF